MKVSYNWLNEYVKLDGTTPSQLADALTTSGLEIEGLEKTAEGTCLKVGRVESMVAHPDSDHLNICQVEYGEGLTQIVCGAPNCKPGIKVIVATVNAELPDIKIKAAKVRGVESYGMLCSLRELGVNLKNLTDEQINGIEILADDAEIGTDPLKYLGLDDYVLDASQTPNRADCMAMWSVAKEVGAVLRQEVKLPECQDFAKIGKPTTLKVSSETVNCPYFLGKVVNKVTIKPSPKWMKNYLEAAGIKSINNVVDISNYVMLETGQPLHFYDLSKMEDRTIRVIDQQELTMVALDQEEYQITKDDLVIANSQDPIGIAGIMGGDDSKIDATTTGIIIEAAHFNHVAIRNTAKRLGLMTEAASRFIKGLEPLAQTKAMDRACQLLQQYADATDFEETVVAGEKNYTPHQVSETLTHCNELLGTSFTMDEVTSVLTALDFKPIVDQDTITCTIPSYRTDILIREDLDEEIIRLIGYDNLKETLPIMPATSGQLTPLQKLRRLTRSVLANVGLSEVVTYTLVKEEFIKEAILPFGNHVQLASAMSEDRKFVRNSLMPSILECVAYNQARKAKNVNLFEISNVYEQGIVQERLALVLNSSLQNNRLMKIDVPADFYTMKGVIKAYLEKCGYEGNRLKIVANDQDTTHFHPYRSACIYLQKQLVGIFGEVHPKYAKEMNVSNVIYAELMMDVLINSHPAKTKFTALNRYPAVSRDISFVCAKETLAQDILDIIIKTNKKLIASAEVFDVYEGEHIEENKKSISFNIIYQAKDHTLDEKEISAVHQAVLENIEKKLNLVLRDK